MTKSAQYIPIWVNIYTFWRRGGAYINELYASLKDDNERQRTEIY